MTEETKALGPTKAEVSERLARVFESFMENGKLASQAGQWKDAAASYQLAGNVALTIASVKDAPDVPGNDLSAGVQFDEE
jgi:hypothetical protein